MSSVLPPSITLATSYTTPQKVATADVRKELNFYAKAGLKVLGVVENMIWFVCPYCSECTNIFSSKGGSLMAEEFGGPFLGSVPIDPEFVMLVEAGKRPRCPTGTTADGQNIPKSMMADDNEGENRDKEQSNLLVEKYHSYSLAPIFKTVTDKVITVVDFANSDGVQQ